MGRSFTWPVEKVNWKLTNAAIAKKFGIARTTVLYARKRLGKPVLPVQRYDWTKVDWTKTNGKIAQQLGCSYATVSNRRRALGIPKVRAIIPSPIGDRVRQRILKLLVKGPLNVGQVNKKLGLVQPSTSRYLRRLWEQGIVERQRKVNRVFYSLTAKGPGGL